MYKHLFIISFLIVTLCYSCGDQSLDEISTPMGEEYIDGDAGIMMLDTFSVELSTVILDSVETTNTGVALVGSFFDEDFGQMDADAVFRVTTPGRISLDEDDIYDSIEFCIKYNDYYLGDTTLTHSFTVEEIESDLEQMRTDRKVDGSNYNSFYNTTTVTSKRVLGEYTAIPKVTDADTIKIPLDDELGRELFELFREDDDNITSTSKFYDYFKGLVLRTNKDINQSVIGYNVSDSCCMKILYHRTMDERVDKEIVFKVESSSNYQFNSIAIDRTGSKLPQIPNQDEKIISSDTDDKCFLQGGTGMYVKIDFPGLKRVETLPALNQIIKAEVVFVPLDKIEDKYNDLPSYLTVYESNTQNEIKSVILSSSGTDYSYMYLYDNSINESDEEYYKVDITSQFVDEFLDGVYDDDFSFLIGLSSSDMTSTLTSLKFAGEGVSDANYQPKLRLYTYYY